MGREKARLKNYVRPRIVVFSAYHSNFAEFTLSSLPDKVKNTLGRQAAVEVYLDPTPVQRSVRSSPRTIG